MPSGRKRPPVDPTASRLPPGLHVALLEHLPDRIAVIDDTGRILAVSGAWRAFALETGAELGSTCEGADYLAVCDAAESPDSETARKVAIALREILASQRDRFVAEYPCHGPRRDQRTWYELHAVGFTWRGRRFATLTHIDSTRGVRAERKRSQTERIAIRMRSLASAYRMAEARLRRAQEAAGVVAFEMDLNGGRTDVSDALREIFVLPPEAELNAASLLATVHPDDRPGMESELQRLAAQGGQLAREFRIAGPDGGIRWLQLRGAAASGPGPPFRFLGAVRDVTKRREAEEALRRSERRYRALVEAGALIMWRADPSGAITESRGWEELTGQPQDAMRGEGWTEVVHPEDRATTLATWVAARAAGEPTEAEFRVLKQDKSWCWVRAKAVPVYAEPGDPEPVEWVGVLEDADQRRRAEERRELLAREVDHRARNVLAVVQAVLRLSRSPTAEELTKAIEGRVAALARAHSLLAEGSWIGADLQAVIAGEIEPYHTPIGPIAEVRGPPVALSPSAAQALSMIFHELATNAAKYGALSRFEGRLSIDWRFDSSRRCLCLTWRERCGPSVSAPPSRRGFGSRVIEATMRNQLGGKMEQSWGEEGLVVELEMPLHRILAEG